MHILLTDILSCPRCEPESGLILLADRVENRRVLEGMLGCPHCRATFSVRAGIADFRADDAPATQAARDEPAAGGDVSERALRWAALMGVAEGPGFLLLLGGPVASLAGAIAAMIEGVEVIADAEDAVAAAPGVSLIMVSDRLPLFPARVRGASVSGAAASGPLLEEAARVVGTGGRLVLDPAPADVDERLARAGLRVLTRQGDTVVAARG